jgi:hypothetical protein
MAARIEQRIERLEAVSMAPEAKNVYVVKFVGAPEPTAFQNGNGVIQRQAGEGYEDFIERAVAEAVSRSTNAPGYIVLVPSQGEV